MTEVAPSTQNEMVLPIPGCLSFNCWNNSSSSVLSLGVGALFFCGGASQSGSLTDPDLSHQRVIMAPVVKDLYISCKSHCSTSQRFVLLGDSKWLVAGSWLNWWLLAAGWIGGCWQLVLKVVHQFQLEASGGWKLLIHVVPHSHHKLTLLCLNELY